MKFIMIFITSLIFLASSAAVASASTMDLTTPWGSTNGKSYPGYLIDGKWVQYSFPKIYENDNNLSSYPFFGTNSYSGPCYSWERYGTCFPNDPTNYFTGILNGANVMFRITLYNNNPSLVRDKIGFTLSKIDSCPGYDLSSPSLTEKNLYDCSEAAGYTNQTVISYDDLQDVPIYPGSSSGISHTLSLTDPGYYEFDWQSEKYEQTYGNLNFSSMFFRVNKIELVGRVVNTKTGFGIPNLEMKKMDYSSGSFSTTITTENGYYKFSGVMPGEEFYIIPPFPSGYNLTSPVVGYYVCQTSGRYESPDLCDGDPGQDLPTDNSYNFSFTPLDIASFDPLTDYDGTTEIVSGTTASVKIKMKNEGGTVWSNNTGYYLGSQDNTWGTSRVDIPVTGKINVMSTVLPGEITGLSCVENSATNKIYCFGGRKDTFDNLTLEILEYSPAADTLITKSAVLPSGRDSLSCAENSATNKIYCFGGMGSGGNLLNEIFEYNPAADTLITKSAVLPSGRYGLSCAENSATNKIYCFGGHAEWGWLGYYSNQILEYNPATDTLITKSAVLPVGVSGLSCTEESSTHKLYCFGGNSGTEKLFGQPEGNLINEIFEYDPPIDTLTTKSAILPIPMWRPSCEENSATNKIYCFGGGYQEGYTAYNSDIIIEYDPVTDTRITKSTVLPDPLISHTCAENNSTHNIYCFGGNTLGDYRNQIHEYTPEEYIPEEIRPGMTAEFNFIITAPTLPDPNEQFYYFNWQMYGPEGKFDDAAVISIKVIPVTVNFTGKVWLDRDEDKIKDNGETCFDSSSGGTATLTAVTSSTSHTSISDCSDSPYQLSVNALPMTNVSLIITVPSYYKSTGWNEGNFATPSAQSGGQENSYTLTVDSSQTTIDKEINFGLKRNDAWFQINGGDLHSIGPIKSNLPSGETFNIASTTMLITSDPTVDIIFGGTSPWIVTSYPSSFTSASRFDYAYYAKLADRVGNTQPFSTPNSPPNSNGTYFYEGDLNLNQVWDVPDGVEATILVHGNLNVNQNVNVPIGSSLALIASGNLVIAENVDTVEGIYLVDGSIDTSVSITPLTATGMFITWTDFIFGRNLEEVNPTTPSEQFIFRPDLLINAPSLLENVPYSWGERLP